MLMQQRNNLQRYGIAVLTSIAALLLTRLLWWQLQPTLYPFFLAAVIISSWYGGLKSGLVATVLTTGLSEYFFLTTIFSLRASPANLGRTLYYVLVAVLICVLNARVRSAQQRAELNAIEVERNQVLLLQNQKRLRESEERVRLLVEGVRDYAIFALDPEGRFVSWNAGAERILGYPETEILGRSFSCIFTSEDIVSGRPDEALRTAIAEGQAQDNRWHVRKDGSLFWANGVVTPLHDAAGNLRGFSKILRDNTAVKQAQEALRASEERFRSLIENVQDYAIFMLDPEGRVASWNRGSEAVLGYQESEILGQPFSRFFPSELIAQGLPQQELQTAVTEGRVQQERLHIRKDGSRFWASEVMTALRDETGRLRGFSKVMRDVTERKRAEAERTQLLEDEQAARAEAEAANRAKDEFLAIVSHELRTPLTAIAGWVGMLQTGMLDEEKATLALETIERNANLQAQLIEDLLDISRIIRGELRLESAVVNLADVITAAVEAVCPKIREKQLQFELLLNLPAGKVENQESAPPDILVWGDADRLQQVMWNLLSNAVKFTPEEGRVTVQLERVEQVEPVAQITVADTGIGIRADFLPHVFDRFRQADSTSTRSYTGLGLGLAIVRYLVEQHNGTITAASPGEGKGATFIVKIPLLQSNELPAFGSQAAQEDQAVDLAGRSILAVDDDDDMRSWLSTLLQSHGAEVIVVDSVAAAIEVLEQTIPSLVVSDIALPNEDGYALVRHLKALEVQNGIQIPAIALTAYAAQEAQAAAIEAGFAGYFVKPIPADDLITAIASQFLQG
ncbi:PAS domain S-box protein [Leptolyngbya ohadii]|uniref:PAS domain S-box protein n=1 Tax=Leptolyngbya ohadii TaxID=1962290 RepID=UPI000B59AD0E|nr:PAS domain S-box protein [Leptolyngbya ohadii]